MKNNNSVAFVAKVNNISPIEGADKIEKVTVNGWDAVSQKGVHKVGDLVVCLTTDAVLPLEFAISHGVDGYLRKGNRVRTVRLKGVYSECILLPVSAVTDNTVVEGDDLQDELGVYKYEPPVVVETFEGGKRVKKSVNPLFYVFHKFPNAKNVPDMFNETDIVDITRKWHGSNGRWSISRKARLSLLDRIKLLFGNKRAAYEFCYGSRTVQKTVRNRNSGFYSTDIWGEVTKKYNIEKRLWTLVHYFGIENIGEGVIIYGEVVGEGVQGERYDYNIKGREVRMFDIQIDGEYVGSVKWGYFNFIELPVVERLFAGFFKRETVDKYVLDNFYQHRKFGKVPHEGVVVTSITGDRGKIAKFINPSYLTYGEKNEVPDGH